MHSVEKPLPASPQGRRKNHPCIHFFFFLDVFARSLKFSKSFSNLSFITGLQLLLKINTVSDPGCLFP